MLRLFVLCIAALLALPAVAQSFEVRVVNGDQTLVERFGLDELLQMSRATVVDPSPQGDQVYEGVWLNQVLLISGVPEGGILRGKSLSTYILVEADDGYQVVFSLAELDEEFGNAKVLIADKLNGEALPEGVGPFRLIVPGDQEGGRWVRQVKTITVHQLLR